MHSVTSSGLSGLVRTVVLCAQTWVVIKMYSKVGSAKSHTGHLSRPPEQATDPRMKQEANGPLTIIPVLVFQ